LTVPKTTFGGSWTHEKLSILRAYLHAYTTALKNQPFRLIYVDAFAGSGFWTPRSLSDLEQPNDFREMWDGSAKIALDIEDRPFDRLVFVEINESRCMAIEALSQQYATRDVQIVNADANSALPDICSVMQPNDRAVVFLDPFATEMSWDTVASLAATGKADCWILFPLAAISRMMPGTRDPLPELMTHLDRVFGGREHWNTLYRDSSQMNLFGDQGQERPGGAGEVIELYRNRLKAVFPGTTSTPRTLLNSKNSPMFSLYFAASSKKGAGIAVRIAEHILQNW
jgi:three-Cys-motif partner protein